MSKRAYSSHLLPVPLYCLSRNNSTLDLYRRRDTGRRDALLDHRSRHRRSHSFSGTLSASSPHHSKPASADRYDKRYEPKNLSTPRVLNSRPNAPKYDPGTERTTALEPEQPLNTRHWMPCFCSSRLMFERRAVNSVRSCRTSKIAHMQVFCHQTAE